MSTSRPWGHMTQKLFIWRSGMWEGISVLLGLKLGIEVLKQLEWSPICLSKRFRQCFFFGPITTFSSIHNFIFEAGDYLLESTYIFEAKTGDSDWHLSKVHGWFAFYLFTFWEAKPSWEILHCRPCPFSTMC